MVDDLSKRARALFNVCNNEKKALSFYACGPDFYQTPAQMQRHIREFLGAGLHRKAIHKFMTGFLGRMRPAPVGSRRIRAERTGHAYGWKMTKFGISIEGPVPFALCWLPLTYGLSATQVLGYSKAPEENNELPNLRLIRGLALAQEMNLTELCDLVGLDSKNTRRRLFSLHQIPNCYDEPVSFVIPAGDGDWIHAPTDKEYDERDFLGDGTIRLALYDRIVKGPVSHEQLIEEGIALQGQQISGALYHLRTRGYIESFTPNQMERFRPTVQAINYKRGCIDSVVGALSGDRASLEYISFHKPSWKDVERACGIAFPLLANS